MTIADIEPLKQYIRNELLAEWKAKGHYLTGQLIDEIEMATEIFATGLSIKGSGLKYAIYMNEGVGPDRIKHPYAPARIAGLARYAKLRMGIQDEKKQRQVAFAIAAKHKIYGMPLRAPQGTKWLDTTLTRIEPEIFQRLSFIYGNSINIIVENLVKQYQKAA